MSIKMHSVSPSERVIDSYGLRHGDFIRPLRQVSRAEASLEQVIQLFADYRRFMSPELMAEVGQMNATERAGFFVAAGKTLREAYATAFPVSPMYRAFPNHEDRLINYELVSFLLAVGLTVDADRDLHGADPVTGEQDERLGADVDADAAHAVPLLTHGRTTYKAVALGTDEMVARLARDLLASLTPFSADQAEFVTACIEEGLVTAEDLASIRFREKLVAFAGLVPEETYAAAAVTVTDGLRLAAHFSGGDVSLAKPVRFDLSTGAAKRVARLAEGVLQRPGTDATSDFLRHEEAWKRLGRHIGKARLEKAAPLLAASLSDLHEGRMQSWQSRFVHASPEDAARVGLERPGELVRSIVALSRRFDREGGDRAVLIEAAVKAFPKATAPALLQLRTHLARTCAEARRVHVMKAGSLLVSERAPEAHVDILAVLEEHLRERLHGLLPWSGVAPGSHRFLPAGNRGASAGSAGAVRGDSVSLTDPEAQVVRLFLHWKDDSDVDLSAVMLDGKDQRLADCSFMSLAVGGHGNMAYAIHSGDIRNGSRGAAEYIDIHIEKARRAGVRSVLMMANVYAGSNFSEFPTHVGMMLRDGQSGKHLEASTVETSMRVSSESTSCTCALFDLETMHLVYADLPANWSQHANVRSKSGEIGERIHLLRNYGSYRTSIADVLAFAGTPGAPVLEDGEAVLKRSAIIAALATEVAIPPAAAPEADADNDTDTPSL